MVHSFIEKRCLSYVRVNYRNASPSFYMYSKESLVTFDHRVDGLLIVIRNTGS